MNFYNDNHKPYEKKCLLRLICSKGNVKKHRATIHKCLFKKKILNEIRLYLNVLYILTINVVRSIHFCHTCNLDIILVLFKTNIIK